MSAVNARRTYTRLKRLSDERMPGQYEHVARRNERRSKRKFGDGRRRRLLRVIRTRGLISKRYRRESRRHNRVKSTKRGSVYR